MAKNILLVHASPRKQGNSDMLADWFERGATEAGNSVTRIDVGHAKISGCMACEYCFAHDGECVQRDDMQEFYPLLREADVIVYATPMYFYNFPAQLRAFQDRMFCGIARPFGVKQAALLLCFEDKDITRREQLPGGGRLLQAGEPRRGHREQRLREGCYRGQPWPAGCLRPGKEHPVGQGHRNRVVRGFLRRRL